MYLLDYGQEFIKILELGQEQIKIILNNMAQITVKNINLGGISNSDYQGSENSVAECVNLDIHNKVGAIRLNHRMEKISEKKTKKK